jgi:NAD(P)-dependent dehydrogenase (short-subunit alcohol dehydrogenase family)
MNLKEQVALITGGSRGLGKAFALALAAKGTRVAITARSEDELKATAKEITDAGGRAVAIPADVADEAAVARVLSKVEQTFGSITLLVNNAAQARAVDFIGKEDPAAWWQEIEINLRGPFLYSQAVLSGMRSRGSGRIINIASVAGLQGGTSCSAYGVSKTALIRFSESLALETASDGIKVFAVHPGVVRTPMTWHLHDAAEVAERVPGLQQWWRNFFAEGADTPIERPVDLILRLAAGEGDSLSGCYIDVEDDLEMLVKGRSSRAEPDYRTLRLKA